MKLSCNKIPQLTVKVEINWSLKSEFFIGFLKVQLLEREVAAADNMKFLYSFFTKSSKFII